MLEEELSRFTFGTLEGLPQQTSSICRRNTDFHPLPPSLPHSRESLHKPTSQRVMGQLSVASALPLSCMLYRDTVNIRSGYCHIETVYSTMLKVRSEDAHSLDTTANLPSQQFWPSTPSAGNTSLPSAPADQATPRAANVNNPFDQVQESNTTTSRPSSVHGLHTGPAAVMATEQQQHQGRASPKLGPLASFPSGLKTPTMAEFGNISGPPMTPPATLGASRPTTGITIGDSLSGTSGMGFGLREPPKMRRALTGGEAKDPSDKDVSTLPGPLDTSSNTSQTASQASSQQYNPERAPRGTLKIKILAGRGLAIPPITSSDPGAKPEPYVVIQFEQNEFVSRPPMQKPSPLSSVSASDKPALPRTNSYGPSLGISSISRAFADAARRTKSAKNVKADGAATPKREETPGLGLGSASPSDPVWKDEVSL